MSALRSFVARCNHALLCLIASLFCATALAQPTELVMKRKNLLDGEFLGTQLVRGRLQRLDWSAGQSLAGLAVPTPVLVAVGNKPGPTVCLTAAVHGDELNGVEVVRRVMYSLKPSQMTGSVVGVPIVNLHGFRRASRYLPDRRDLNRFFPGNPQGSSAARIAWRFFNDVISRCDRLVDIHTGSFHRTNLTQLRADLGREDVREFSKLFGDITVLHGEGAVGTLRRATVEAGIPAITIEAGEPLHLQRAEVAEGARGINAVLTKMGIIQSELPKVAEQQVYYQSKWLRADHGGILFSVVDPGQIVQPGELLGSVTDPISNTNSEIRAPTKARILGMALNQMVMPGFAAYHLGIIDSDNTVVAEEAAERAAEEALEPVKAALKTIARKAANETAAAGKDEQAVNEAAQEAAKAATGASQSAPPKAKSTVAPVMPAEQLDHPE